MSILYIDLETIPSQRPEVREMVKKKIKPPNTYKKPESIAKWLEENIEAETDKKLHETCFNGTWGEIVCIGWAIDDGAAQAVYRAQGEPEGGLIEAFWEHPEFNTHRADGHKQELTWCAHNGSGFDFRFLWQRCVVNQVKPPIKIPYDAKPWSKDAIDTLSIWTGVSKAGGSLDNICKAFGMNGKDGMDGSQVYGEWLAGNYEDIAAYCVSDVEMVRAIYKRMMFS